MPRSAAESAAIREHTRGVILDAAVELFGERGYTGTSIADIAERAGVSRGLPNYHFIGKEQILAAAIDRWFAALISHPFPGTADEQLAGIIDGVLLSYGQGLAAQRAIVAIALQPTTLPLFAEAEARNEAVAETLENTLRDVFAARGAAEPVLEEIMLRTVLEGVLVKLAIYPDTYPLEGARRWLYRQFGLDAPSDELFPETRLQNLRTTAP